MKGVLRFTKYSSIPNLTGRSLQKVDGLVKQDDVFVVLEKAHGAHFSLQTNGRDHECARRNGVLTLGDHFFTYDAIITKYREAMYKIFDIIKCSCNDVKSIQIDGELIGGIYPHDDVEESKDAIVKKEIYYTPKHVFYAYDIKYFDSKEETWVYIDYDVCMEIFDKCGFFYAKPLFTGPFTDAIQFKETFQTTLPERLGYPTIKDNIAEGW